MPGGKVEKVVEVDEHHPMYFMVGKWRNDAHHCPDYDIGFRRIMMRIGFVWVPVGGV